jgi:hypothetical protein
MEEYKVYIKVNELGYITAVNSSAFITDISGWEEIDSGTGDKFHHAQGNYFEKPIMTDNGAYRYKLIDGKPVECTQDEIVQQEEANKPIETYSAQDDTDAMLVDHEYRLTLLELGITE